MLVDEATSDRLQNFPIVWPEEQYLTPFHFILTGSAGIAKFVAERHLERQVWDLPLFDLQETANLALRLQDALNIPTEVIEGAFGLNLDDDEQKKEKIGEYLDGLFGGVPGYVTELFLALSRKNVSLTSYMTALKSNVHDIVEKAVDAKKKKARLWLDQMYRANDPWLYARKAGLCGLKSPRGAIFRYMLEALFFFAPQDNALEIVKCFRSRLQDDPLRVPLIKLEGEQLVPEAEETVPPQHTKAQVASVKKC
ncbi:hypothetical protein AC1031_010914 [Aphanomyces cochlioides]|nr:hypothetical protein AC1031_010914 [Aphanomyces cochlioides]